MRKIVDFQTNVPRPNRIGICGISMCGLVALFVGAFLPTALFAQTRCPVGAQAGSAQCLPDDEASAPSRPTGEWIKTWGGIASAPNGEGGVSSGQLSKADAENVALQNCRATGAGQCKVNFVYYNQCVALAYPVGSAGGFFRTGKTIDEAVKLAVVDCEREMVGHQCKIKVNECTDPVFRKY
ncbi:MULTISPECIES: DUF4189 domain-containing protein [Xanthomonas]|uniref:DUF4189 domain-containing protein n=1 Tax=Xanthomonas TaxID=338 RepID=UPI00168A9E6F|nr:MULTISPECIES: DUF4189 domain-containing protein [Xanthomonas]